MSLIEGIGDEVTLILCLFFLGVVLMLAWISTHTADIPLLREVGVIVVELSQRRSRTRNYDGNSNVNETRNTGSSERTSSLIDPQTEEHLENDSSASTNRREENTNVERAKINNGSTAETSYENSSNQTLTEASNFQLNVSREQESESSAQVLGEQMKSSDELSNHEEAENLVPNASVVVLENSGSFHVLSDELSTDEELRRRRVQFFQSSQLNSLSEGAQISKPPSGGSADVSSLPKAQQINKDNPQSQFSGSLNTLNPIDPSNQNVSASGQTDHDEVNASLMQSPDVSTRHEQDGDTSTRIRVKLKYMNETQRLVYASPLDTIGDFRRSNFQAELQDNKWVRFIYNGQDLRDDARTLQACNISDNCTMHCLITSPTRTATSRDARHEDEDDTFMGALMYPLFTVILLIVWYCRFTYRQYFSAMSTVCLIGITFLLALSYVSSLRVNEQPPSQSTAPAAGGRPQHEHAE